MLTKYFFHKNSTLKRKDRPLHTITFPAFHSVKAEGDTFHSVIFHYWEKLLTNCFLKMNGNLAGIMKSEFFFFFWSHRAIVPKLGKTLTGAENTSNPQGKSNVTIRSRKRIECNIICIAYRMEEFIIENLYWFCLKPSKSIVFFTHVTTNFPKLIKTM